MISLILSFVVLIGGYFIYSRFVNRAFAPDSRRTPAVAINDGVDCVPMPKRKLVLVQLLNIAGTGPIFGPIMGAVFGPVVFLWIILGTILGGAVHDFMIGMISMRHNGSSIAELSGIYAGKVVKWIMRVFSVILLILCGTVFLVTPATLLADLTPAVLNKWFWVAVIVAYYFLATILPIDKIIGKLYPVFGLLLLTMAFSVLIAVFVQGKAVNIPEIWQNFGKENPNGLPTWPFMFVTVACGAISGFHATQSPMVSKCVRNEREGRQIFYGAMVGEAIIALIWAAVGVAFYGSAELLQAALTRLGGAGPVVNEICSGLLGKFGGILAIIGVVVCPITSGDTAFRGARLIIAETLHLNQKKIINRLLITVPLIAMGLGLCFLDFDVLWRYFAAANQTLAMVALWIASFYMLKKNKFKHTDLITAIPASFMVAVSITYIIVAKECIHAPIYIGYPIGAAFAITSFIAYIIYRTIYLHKHRDQRMPIIVYSYKKNEMLKKGNLNLRNELKKEKMYIANKDDILRYSIFYLPIYKKEFENQKKKRIKRLNKEKEETIKIIENEKTKTFSKYKAKIKLNKLNYKIKKSEKDKFTTKAFFEISTYILSYALKNGTIYSSDSENSAFVVTFPGSFQGINYDTFKGALLKLKLSLNFGLHILYYFQGYDEETRVRQEETLSLRYYIYTFVKSENAKNSTKLLTPLFNISNKDNAPIYLDIINEENEKYFLSKGFKIAVKEEALYYNDLHTILFYRA